MILENLAMLDEGVTEIDVYFTVSNQLRSLLRTLTFFYKDYVFINPLK